MVPPMQDWFSSEHAICDAVAELAAHYPVHTASKFLALLARKHPSFKKRLPQRGTLRNWFTFPGRERAAAYPKPTKCWTRCYKARCNIVMRESGGPKPKLFGCEEAVADALKTLQSLRHSGTPMNTALARAILVSSLKQHGCDILSPHLLDKDGAVDPTRFMAGQKWLSRWLRDAGMSWRAVTGDHGKEPEDWREQCDRSLLRMAGKAQYWDISPARCFQADQTYVYFKPAAAYVPFHSIANMSL
jgi:hypothetical protein